MTIEQYAAMTAEQAGRYMTSHVSQPARRRVAEIVGAAPVIDIGCGPAYEIADLYLPHQYFGIDCSEAIIGIARANAPGYEFEVADARSYTPHPARAVYGIIKSMLEHLPPDEAKAVYDNARGWCDTLLVVWHTEPWARPTKVETYFGELGEMLQIRHNEALFDKPAKREVCGVHAIWTCV